MYPYIFKKYYHLHSKISNQHDYLLVRGRKNKMVFRHTASSKYKQQLMKTLVRILTNMENMKMRSINPCRKTKGSEFLVSGFLEVNCTSFQLYEYLDF